MARERIVVVQAGRLGDMILTTPLLMKLKAIRPEAQLTVLSSPLNSVIARHCPAVDEVAEYSKNPLKDYKLLFSHLKNADIWIDAKPEYSRTSAYLKSIFKPLKSAGYRKENLDFDFDLTYHRRGDHYTDIFLTAVKFYSEDYSDDDRIPFLEIPGIVKPVRNADSLLKVIVNISAGKQCRKLPLETVKELIKLLKSEANAETALICGHEDRQSALEIADATGSQYYPTETIIDAATLIKEADAVVTPDTSIVHLCSALGKPVAAIYPNVEWNLRRFSPLSNCSEVIVSDDPDSIEKVKPQEIVEVFMRLADCAFGGNAESRTRVRKEDH